MVSGKIPLRMNQGDPSESRVYFLPHFVAERLGLFAQEGVTVDFVWAQPGDFLAKSGQIPAVLSGEADFTVGGPMVTMKMFAEGSAQLVSFSALVRRNPWFLAARNPAPDFAWSGLAGKSVLDVGAITTASLSFRWVLAKNGIAETDLRFAETGKAEDATFADFLAGEGDYVFHSLHALGPYLARGELHLVAALAEAHGDVPWSAYIALPQTLSDRATDIEAFLRAMARALAWVDEASPEAIAALVTPDYPDYPAEGLHLAIARYKAIGVWATDPLIPRADFDRFRDLLMDMGWFASPVRYEDLVAEAPARRAIAAMTSR